MAETAKPSAADLRKTSVGEYGNGNPPSRTARSQSLTTSTLPSNVPVPPELETQWRRRRESLEKLQLDKVAPWIHLYDFTETEGVAVTSAPNSP